VPGAACKGVRPKPWKGVIWEPGGSRRAVAAAQAEVGENLSLRQGPKHTRRALQVHLALKARGLRDDITVIVLDALPDADARLPPLLQRPCAGAAGADAAGVVVARPLEQTAGAWSHAVWCAAGRACTFPKVACAN
jgi:hypothetical protein